MSLQGTTGIVTGGSRGLGRAIVEALLARGAKRVYATSRTLTEIDFDDDRVTPVQLDITDHEAVSAVAERCGDVDVVINNAGALFASSFITPRSVDAARIEMDTNYFGTLAMARAFAPVLATNGGGVMVNILSAASFYSLPSNASYSASKAAEWSLTNSLRIELHAQGTNVIGVHASFIDTEMTAAVAVEKISPADVAGQVLDAVESGVPEVLADARTRHIKETLPRHLTTLYPELQRQWDAGETPWHVP